jgi:SAM-dependent methyltransferase
MMELVERSVAQGISAAMPRLQAVGSALALGDASTRLSNLWWERRLRISTGGVIPVSHGDSHHYATMNYTSIWSVLDHLDLGPSDVFVDVGCGKGRVLCCAARRPVGRVVGVDLSEPFCELARENARGMRGRRAPIFVETAFADEFDYSDATALFLFDPFGPATLGALLEKIGRELRGSLRIAYANPTHESVFQRQSWLELSDRWSKATSDIEHSVSFYRSV